MPRSEPDADASHTPLRIARVAVEGAPLHLGDALDYLPPGPTDAGADESLSIGQRVELSLAGRRTRGLVVDLTSQSDVPPSRLRRVGRTLGDVPWTDEAGIALFAWAAARFGAPLGDVIRHALPGRVVDEERRAIAAGWWPPSPSDVRSEGSIGDLATAAEVPHGWAAYEQEGAELVAAASDGSGSYLLQPLPGEDLGARIAELAVRCLAGGRDVLIVVPDPVSSVAEQVIAAVRDVAGLEPDAIVDLRGGPSARLAYRGWLRARAGRARVVVGERSATFTPLARLGLTVLVDESSPVHKEQRSPRHHAREVLLERARRAGGVGLLTADVPSALTRSLVLAGRVAVVAAPDARVAEQRPVVRLDTGELEARARISRAGMRVLRDAVAAGGYGVVLAARRGEGRALVCSRCHDLVRCSTCSAAIARTPSGGWWCPSCGATSERAPRCERCGPGPLAPLAAGAERLGAELARSFDVPVAVLEGHAPDVPPAPAVLVMTRGSVLDRPPGGGPVRGVVLPDLDGALRRPTLDAAEDALRLAFRVAGWTAALPLAERGTGPSVVVETRDADHHALRALVDWDAEAFWLAEAELRRPLDLPPHRPAIRIEAASAALLADVRTQLAPGDGLVGPLPLERGRIAMLVRSSDRPATLSALRPLRDRLSRQGVELRVDVDPVDLG